jgi:hypothetical protein
MPNPLLDEKALDPAVAQIIDDLKSDIAVLKAAIAGYKSTGVSGAIQAAAPLIASGPAQVQDVIKAWPTIKGGFATSEGKIQLGIHIVSALVVAFAPNLSSQAIAIISVANVALGGLYTISRTLVKNGNASALASTVAAVAAPAQTSAK